MANFPSTRDNARSAPEGNQNHSGAVSPTTPASLFSQLGEDKLREIIDAFIDRVFADRMIGFFFRHADSKRIKEMEYQLAANFFGADMEYGGRPLDQAHAKHPIMGGHFARRRQILKETLDSFGVADSIKEAWLRHTDELRPLITPEPDSGCDPIAARQRVDKRAAGEL